jgi:hypothetical protein
LEVSLSLTGREIGGQLESLDTWLRQEPGLSGRVRLSRPRPEPGQLGALSEALIVAVGAGGTVSVLASSLGAWLSRPRGGQVRIKVRGAGGKVVEITAPVRAEEAERLLRQVLDTAGE